MSFLFAWTTPDSAAEGLAQFAQQAASQNRLYWDGLWQSLFSSGLWLGLEAAAGVVAGLALLVWGAFFLRGLIEEDSTPALSELLWPLLVIFGLVHTGSGTSNLAGWINSARTVPYTLVDIVSNYSGRELTTLSTATGPLDLHDTILLAEYRVGMEQLVRNLYNQCATLPVGQFKPCLAERRGDVRAVLAVVRSRVTTSEAFESAAQEIDQVFSGTIDPYTAVSATRALFARDATVDGWMVMLLSWQKNTVPTLEYALMVSASLAPLCLAASLLPVGNRSILGWAAGFAGICTAYFSYYILLGLGAHNYVFNLGFGLDGTAFLMKTCLVDPLIALVLGIGSTRSLLWGGGYLLTSPHGYGFGLLRRGS
ncbi:MAG: hypothetical protein KME03_17350 [Aphanocapsa lilacina HA4352-LM1]|nr:hypothetical protein [Aphanocapsa lilacina HA4352-LM1]